MIRLENVSKVYRPGKVELTVLKNINLTIKKGSFTVILGSSGSGKSTLLHIVSCLDTASSGKVFFENRDVSKISEDELAEIRNKRIGFVFQQFNLLSGSTALENVVLPMIFREKIDLVRAENLLKAVGLGHRINHKPTEMSGGEQQRVAVARSLANNPDIIVADEPTGNVDSKNGESIMKILSDLNKEGRTLIIVTHDASLTKYADDVITIKDGEIQ
jgi:putative ABC transport system ATP-binding protein